MSFHPGKANKERAKLRAIVDNPRSPQIQRDNAKAILRMTDAKLSQFDDGDQGDAVEDEIDEEAVQQLLDKALEFLGQFNTESARVCVDEALKLAHSLEARSAVLDVASQILISDQAPPEQVLAILNESETLTPLSSHERLLDLAQFSTGTECLKYYQNAIKLMEGIVAGLHTDLAAIPKGKQHQEDREECQFEIDDLSQVAATAMVAIAELYTTDLCDENNAETQCGLYLDMAMKTDPMNVEAHRSMGNYAFIRYDNTLPTTDINNQNLLATAIKHSKKAYQILRQCYEQGLDHKIPEFTPRLELGRQLYELQCWEEALTVLTMILQEELEVAEIWLLCVVSSYKLAEQLHHQTQHPSIAKFPNKVKQLNEQITSLLVCAAQYCVNCGRVIEAAEDKDKEIIAELKEYVGLLKNKGYSLADAKKALDQGANGDDYDESILQGIESDSDDDDDKDPDGTTGGDDAGMGMGE